MDPLYYGSVTEYVEAAGAAAAAVPAGGGKGGKKKKGVKLDLSQFYEPPPDKVGGGRRWGMWDGVRVCVMRASRVATKRIRV